MHTGGFLLEGQSASLQKNYRSDKNRQVKNGGSGKGRWCEREFQEDSGKELGLGTWKVWKGTAMDERGCVERGELKEKRKTDTETAGLSEERFRGNGKEAKNESGR